jgi:hypothetical protein
VRVVCFGISGTIAMAGDTGCWAPADIAVRMAASDGSEPNEFRVHRVLSEELVWNICADSTTF